VSNRLISLEPHLAVERFGVSVKRACPGPSGRQQGRANRTTDQNNAGHPSSINGTRRVDLYALKTTVDASDINGRRKVERDRIRDSRFAVERFSAVTAGDEA